MKLPIYAYGNQVLREPGLIIEDHAPGLDQLVSDLWETMEHAHGCGLAAQQIGHALKLFVVDSRSTFLNLSEADREGYFETGDEGIRETFINADLLSCSAQTWEDNEGCLSIPQLTQSVTRPWSVTIAYQDRYRVPHTRTFAGITARMIQHEYDHTRGILYPDLLTPIARKRLEGKLKKISRGSCKAGYPMHFAR